MHSLVVVGRPPRWPAGLALRAQVVRGAAAVVAVLAVAVRRVHLVEAGVLGVAVGVAVALVGGPVHGWFLLGRCFTRDASHGLGQMRSPFPLSQWDMSGTTRRNSIDPTYHCCFYQDDVCG